MPLSDRTILPIWLGRRPLTEEEKAEDVALIAVSHNAVLGAIVQLASLVRHADDIFCDLAEECQALFEKTESIAAKIRHVDQAVRNLDSTEVKIPVGTLKEFNEVTDHHVAKHGFDCDLFVPTNRPHCIKFLYSLCETTPVHALRGADMYRKDGLCSSHLFKLWPIALKDPLVVQNDDIRVNKKPIQVLTYKKRYKTLKLRQRPKTIHSIDEIFNETDQMGSEVNEVGKGQHLSKSQPSVVVAVNTSGEGFERMASFRASLREDGKEGGGGKGKDRKRRRRTVSGVPDNILHEIEQFEESRRTNRSGPRQYSLDDLDQKDLEMKDSIMQQYLQEIDNQIAEREELEYAHQREAKLLKFLPCRRSRSLPRCVKLLSHAARVGSMKGFSSGGDAGANSLTRSSLYEKKSNKAPTEEVRRRQPADGIQGGKMLGSSTSMASIGSSERGGGEGRASRSAKRRSLVLVGDKIKSFVGTLRPRPKSLDFDSIEVKDDDDGVDENDGQSGGGGVGRRRRRGMKVRPPPRSHSLGRVNSHEVTIPQDNLTRATSSESTVGPGSYYYFDSHTIPRAQAKKYDFPWDSLPKDWTTSVKLREISKRRKEDRQSSSGNWSQSGYSSNRQSMDSDVRSSHQSSTSQHSIGRDSGRDSPVAEKLGMDTAYMGYAASCDSVSETKSMSNADSDDWIRGLAERAASRGDVTSTSAEALANLSRLTKQNIRNLDILVPGRTNLRKKRNELEDDGESSVYSLDQEGFYTSFHNDSGLRRSTNELLDEDDDLMMPRVRESKSLQSVTSYNTVESVIFKGKDEDAKGSVSSPNLAYPGHTLVQVSDFTESDIPDIDALNDEQVEFGETGTLKRKKTDSQKKKVPPPPPPRTSSIKDEGDTTPKQSPSTPTPDDKGFIFDSPNESPPNADTSSECSDTETIHARLKMKTNISAHIYPSWCAGITSDDDETVVNTSHERLYAESSELEEMFQSGTLPRSHTSPGHKSSEDAEHPSTNSWPRLKRLPTTPGILKTPEKDKIKLQLAGTNPKILNFDPIVNLFDAKSPHGVQLPLSRMSSSDESSSSLSNTSTFNSPSVKLPDPAGPADKQPVLKGHTTTQEGTQLVSKYQPSSGKARTQTMTTSTPISRNQTKGSSDSPKAVIINADENDDSLPPPPPPLSTSIPSMDSFHDCLPQSQPLQYCDKLSDTMSSNSTIALSDIDSGSLTHVSLDDSSHSGSTLSLTWDTDYTPNVTPTATPARKRNAPDVLTGECPVTPTNESNSSDKESKESKFTFPEPSNANQYQSSSSSSSSSMLHQPFSQNSVLPVTNSSSSSTSGPILLAAPKISYTQSGGSGNRPTTLDASGHHQQQQQHMQTALINNNNNNEKKTNLMSSGTELNAPTRFSYQESKIMPSASSSWSSNANIQSSKEMIISQSQSRMHELNGQGYQSSGDTKTGRRRSSPIMGQNRNRSNSSNYGSSEPNSQSQDGSRRRRSGDAIYSPADSGFGSPTVFGNPSPNSATQPFTYNARQSSGSSSSVSSNGSRVPQIKTPLLGDSTQRGSPQFSQKYGRSMANGRENGPNKGEHQPIRAHHSSGSSDSLSSQNSGSSNSKLIQGSNAKFNFSRPGMKSGHSSESLQSNSSAGRSDSYRVALMSDFDDASLLPPPQKKLSGHNFSRTNSEVVNSKPAFDQPRHTLSKSMSAPNAGIIDYEEDPVSRVDSYRMAVRNTQAQVMSEIVGRNTSYRLATCEEDVVIKDNRMDACNLWTGSTGGKRDVRRMGITDVDQLKHYSMQDGKSGNKRSIQKAADSLHVRKKLAVKPEHDIVTNVGSKTPPADHKRLVKSNSKDKNKAKTQSSTYIRFDPIFESGEDLRASTDSLRPPSITSIRTLAKAESNETITSENTNLIGQKSRTVSPGRRRSSSQSRRSVDDKSGMSFLGSIRTTFKSIGGGKGE